MRLVPHLFRLGLGSVLLACSSTPVITTTITRPELVAVSPDDFLGNQRCGDGPDQVKSYVATLFDVTNANDGGPDLAEGFPLPSSPATPCEFPVTFSLVVVGHRYRAAIDAYDRRPAASDSDPDLTHIRAVSLGGPLQVDGTGARVTPRWTARCGGYPPTDLDAGANAATGGAGGATDGSDSAGAAGAADVTEGAGGADAGSLDLPGVVSYDTLTTTVHNCPGGLK